MSGRNLGIVGIVLTLFVFAVSVELSREETSRLDALGRTVSEVPAQVKEMWETTISLRIRQAEAVAQNADVPPRLFRDSPEAVLHASLIEQAVLAAAGAEARALGLVAERLAVLRDHYADILADQPLSDLEQWRQESTVAVYERQMVVLAKALHRGDRNRRHAALIEDVETYLGFAVVE